MTADVTPGPADLSPGGPEDEALVDRAFGADSRARMLDEYFRNTDPVTTANAWIHVYRLLLWIDPTTSLAHCYESDKSQPGRPWYARSLAFHTWLARALRTTPARLADEIDWMFKRATQQLTAALTGQMQVRAAFAALQRQPYADTGVPEPGKDPALERIIFEELGPWLPLQPPADVLHRLTQHIRTYMTQENKRRNLIGEGFEDVLAAIITRIPGGDRFELRTRNRLSRLPGFNRPAGAQKEKTVDLAILGSAGSRVLVTAKWSVRADREEQFESDHTAYIKLESLGQDIQYVLLTNEFDAARLVAACERRVPGAALFSEVVHVNPEGLRVVHEPSKRRTGAASRLKDYIANGRLTSLERWLQGLVPS